MKRDPPAVTDAAGPGWIQQLVSKAAKHHVWPLWQEKHLSATRASRNLSLPQHTSGDAAEGSLCSSLPPAIEDREQVVLDSLEYAYGYPAFSQAM